MKNVLSHAQYRILCLEVEAAKELIENKSRREAAGILTERLGFTVSGQVLAGVSKDLGINWLRLKTKTKVASYNEIILAKAILELEALTGVDIVVRDDVLVIANSNAARKSEE